MPIRDVAAMNASLDNDYGVTRGEHAADSHELALFFGDPTLGGVEVTGGGYARPLVGPGDWSDAEGGSKSTAAPVQFADATGPWDQATHWQLFDSDNTAIGWDGSQLVEALDVTGAGPGPAVQVSVFYAETVTAAE